MGEAGRGALRPLPCFLYPRVAVSALDGVWSSMAWEGEAETAANRPPSPTPWIETCQAHGINTQAWLTDVLGRIADHKITRIHELLPWRYAAAAA